MNNDNINGDNIVVRIVPTENDDGGHQKEPSTLLLSNDNKGITITPVTNAFKVPMSTPKDVGFRNRSNYCYMNAMFTALYHLLGLREHILFNESNNMLMTALMHTFYQLYRRVDTQNVEEFLLPVMKRFGVERTVEPGKADDASAFWRFLIDKLPSLGQKFFAMETMRSYFIEGELVSSTVVPETCFVASTLDGDKKYIDEYLQSSKSYNVEYLSSSLSEETKERLKTKFKEGFPEKLEAVSEIKIMKLPSILPIEGGVFKMTTIREASYTNQGELVSPIAISQLISLDEKFVFRRTFEIHGKTYHLVSYISYRNPNHYVCRALYDIAQDLWAEFDDSRVIAVEWDKYESKEQENNSYPYLLFYVEDDIFTEWKNKTEIKASTRNILYTQSLQLTIDAMKVWQKLLPRSGIVMPGLDAIAPPSPGEQISEPKQVTPLSL